MTSLMPDTERKAQEVDTVVKERRKNRLTVTFKETKNVTVKQKNNSLGELQIRNCTINCKNIIVCEELLQVTEFVTPKSEVTLEQG